MVEADSCDDIFEVNDCIDLEQDEECARRQLVL